MANEKPTEIRMSGKDSDINNMENASPADIAASKPEHVLVVDRDAERKLIRRIDFIMMPMMIVSYLFQYLDKASIANASVMGLIPDLNLRGQQYSWLGSIFYIGYLVASYPVSVMFVRFHLGKSLAISVILWGAVLACHAAANSWAVMMVLRTFLGAFESTIAPGFTLITSIWYRKSEHASRHGIWFAGNSFGAIIGALIAYGLAHVTGGPLEPWRWLFILLGGLTVLWGVFLFLRLPDSPLKAPFLSPEERIAIHERVQSQQKTAKTDAWRRNQFLECLMDPQVWILAVFNIAMSMVNGLVSNFSSLIISSFGFDTLSTLLLNMPLYAFQFIIVVGSTILAHRLKRSRLFICVGGNVIALIGVVLIRQLPHSNRGGRYCGILLVMAFCNNFPLVLSLISSNVGGFTKRSTTSAVFFIAYCVGNLAGPQLFIPSEGPKYTTAFTSMLVIFVLNSVLLLALRVYLDRKNKKRDSLQGVEIDPESREIEETGHNFFTNGQEEDQTDWENQQFRYTL